MFILSNNIYAASICRVHSSRPSVSSVHYGRMDATDGRGGWTQWMDAADGCDGWTRRMDAADILFDNINKEKEYLFI